MLDREKVLEWIEKSKYKDPYGDDCVDVICFKNSITNGDFDVKEEK